MKKFLTEITNFLDFAEINLPIPKPRPNLSSRTLETDQQPMFENAFDSPFQAIAQAGELF